MIGFALVTVGALLAGIANQVPSVGGGHALVIESAFTALGFAVITYSLYVE